MKIDDYNVNIFKKFNNDWALLTVGDKNKYNTMAISWGTLGTLWHKEVVIVFVRKSRYTHEFIENNEYFTVSFYSDKYKKDLGILGSVSGRDKDKVSLTKLTPEFLDNTTTFKEASETLVCKKIYMQDMDINSIPSDIKETLYSDFDIHTIVVGEVVDILSK